jgi:hypothetical protein
MGTLRVQQAEHYIRRADEVTFNKKGREAVSHVFAVLCVFSVEVCGTIRFQSIPQSSTEKTQRYTDTQRV